MGFVQVQQVRFFRREFFVDLKALTIRDYSVKILNCCRKYSRIKTNFIPCHGCTVAKDQKEVL